MDKDQLFIGQPILSQLLSFIDKKEVDTLARKHRSDRYTKKFATYDHLVTMLYCIFHRCTSLREVSTGMQACFTKLNHLGMRYCPRRSTLSDANRRRTVEVFEEIYMLLYKKFARSLPDSQKKESWFSKLFIADSTTISLFKEIMKCAGNTPANGKRKGGMKVHTLIKADQDVPCLVRMSPAANHDVSFIKGMELPEGSIIVFDKGYVNYDQYDCWTKEKVAWVTRLRKGSKFEVTDQLPISVEQQKAGIIADELVILGHTSHNDITRTKARLVTYYDASKDNIFYFITNNQILNPETIALIYKHRWQIELLFKRVKQTYPLQYFLGDNENAIKVQVWCALIADLLIKYVKSQLKRKWSYANISSMIRLHLMTYIHLFRFLENPDKALINDMNKKENIPNLFSSA